MRLRGDSTFGSIAKSIAKSIATSIATLIGMRALVASAVVTAVAIAGCEERGRSLSLARDQPSSSAPSVSSSPAPSSSTPSAVASGESTSGSAASASASASTSASAVSSANGSVPQLHYGFVTLTGTLSEQTFYGPPGFGADPAHDAKEPVFVLQLSTPVDVLRNATDDDWNEDRIGVRKVSIAATKDPSVDMHKFVGHPVKLKGKLFGAHSPKHHTDVVMGEVEVVPE